MQLALTAHLKPSTTHPITEPPLPSVSQKWILKLLLVEEQTLWHHFFPWCICALGGKCPRGIEMNQVSICGFFFFFFLIFNISDAVKQKGQGTNTVYF